MKKKRKIKFKKSTVTELNFQKKVNINGGYHDPIDFTKATIKNCEPNGQGL